MANMSWAQQVYPWFKNGTRNTYLGHIRKINPEAWIQNVTQLSGNAENSDVSLSLKGGEMIPCHKMFLARSSILSQNLDGAITVPCEDMDAEVATVLVKYLYSDRIPDQLCNGTLSVLLPCAARHGLPHLVELCSDALSNCITVATAVGTLAQAVEHEQPHLEYHCHLYIRNFFENVKQSSGYKDMLHQPKVLESIVGGVYKPPAKPTASKQHPTLADHLKKFLGSDTYSDMKILLVSDNSDSNPAGPNENETIPAHACLLRAHSHVFRTTVHHQQEPLGVEQVPELRIECADAGARNGMKRMLAFLYTNDFSFERDQKSATNLASKKRKNATQPGKRKVKSDQPEQPLSNKVLRACVQLLSLSDKYGVEALLALCIHQLADAFNSCCDGTWGVRDGYFGKGIHMFSSSCGWINKESRLHEREELGGDDSDTETWDTYFYPDSDNSEGAYSDGEMRFDGDHWMCMALGTGTVEVRTKGKRKRTRLPCNAWNNHLDQETKPSADRLQLHCEQCGADRFSAAETLERKKQYRARQSAKAARNKAKQNKLAELARHRKRVARIVVMASIAAEAHSLQDLKWCCLTFMGQYFQAVQAARNYSDLAREQPKVLMDFMERWMDPDPSGLHRRQKVSGDVEVTLALAQEANTPEAGLAAA
jgi:hypothetical protein